MTGGDLIVDEGIRQLREIYGEVFAGFHPHTTCPSCKATRDATANDLVAWFVKHGWRESKQELVEHLLKEFTVTRKEKV